MCMNTYIYTCIHTYTRGDPWVPALVKQNLNRTQKYKVFALKKIKDILRTFPGGSLGALSREAKFKQDKIYEVIYSVRT
jgi:hypothetical protein